MVKYLSFPLAATAAVARSRFKVRQGWKCPGEERKQQMWMRDEGWGWLMGWDVLDWDGKGQGQARPGNDQKMGE